MLAYAGSLSFYKPYRQELEQVKQKWLALPAPKPAAGPWASERLARHFGGSQTGEEYYQLYDTFRSRRHLAMLVSWDVPWPMGPDEFIPASFASIPFGQSGVFEYHPPFLDTPPMSVRQKHDLAAAMAEMFPYLPKLPPMRVVRQGSGPNEYETSFRMWLVELTARRHYSNLRGMSEAMIRGFATHLNRTEEHVKRLRRMYTRFLTS